MTQKSCCKCQSTITIQSSTSRHSTWCRQCFIDQLHIKFFQAFKVAKDYCRPPPPNTKNKLPSNQSRSPSSSLAIHFENNLNSFVTLHLIKNYLKTNQVRSTDKWKSPIDFDSIQVVWVNPGSASKYLSTDSSVLHSKSEQNNDQTSAQTHEDEDEEDKIKSIVESLGFKLVALNLDDLFFSSSSVSASSSTLVQSNSNISRCFVDLSDPNLPILKTDSSTDHSKIVRNQTSIIREEEKEEENGTSDDKDGEICETNLEKILRPLTKTSRNSLIEILTCITLLNFCKQTSSRSSSISEEKHQVRNNKVLVKSTSSTRLAIDTLLNVSLGNGFCLDQIVGPSSYIDDVLICRPIYQILDVELIEYAKFMHLTDHFNAYNLDQNNLQSLDDPGTNSSKKIDNIPALITGFIKKLEENYPLTSSVINQTVNKIGKNKVDVKSLSSSASRTCCRICLRVLDSEANQWKKSITLSAHEARKKKIKKEVGIDQPEKDVGKDIEERNSLREDICFACLVTFTDHLYAFNPPASSSSSPDWIQLPNYFLLDPPPPPPPTTTTHTSQTGYIQSVLDELMLKD